MTIDLKDLLKFLLTHLSVNLEKKIMIIGNDNHAKIKLLPLPQQRSTIVQIISTNLSKLLTWCDGIAATWLIRLHDIKANTKEIHAKGDEDKADANDDEYAYDWFLLFEEEEYQLWSDDDFEDDALSLAL